MMSGADRTTRMHSCTGRKAALLSVRTRRLTNHPQPDAVKVERVVDPPDSDGRSAEPRHQPAGGRINLRTYSRRQHHRGVCGTV